MDLPQFQLHAELEEHHWWFRARRVILRTVLNMLLPEKEKVLIIDVGCGTGGNTTDLARDYHCIGIDPIPEAIVSAQSRFPGIDFRKGYAPEDIPEIAQADAVLIMDVLEHIEDDFLFVSTLLQAMKPGALLLMMTPADLSLWSVHDKGFDHFRRYDRERLHRVWEGLAVEEEILTYCNARLYPLVKLSRILSRMLGRSMGGADTDLSLPPGPLNALLFRIFSGEAKRIGKIMTGNAAPYRHGVSLFAVLRRREGTIVPRGFPADLLRDPAPWKN